MQSESGIFFQLFFLRMSLPSLGRVKTQLKWKGYMYAQPFESLYNTNHPIDVCFLLLSVREGLEKGWNISYWEYAHTKSAQVFLLVASSSLLRCGKCSGLLNMYAEIGRYLRPLGKLSLHDLHSMWDFDLMICKRDMYGIVANGTPDLDPFWSPYEAGKKGQVAWTTNRDMLIKPNACNNKARCIKFHRYVQQFL